MSDEQREHEAELTSVEAPPTSAASEAATTAVHAATTADGDDAADPGAPLLESEKWVEPIPDEPQQGNAAQQTTAEAETPADAPAAAAGAIPATGPPAAQRAGAPREPDTKSRKPKPEENLFPFSVTVGKVYDGPLDLLLDLIRKQDIDIWDIPIARITAQFLAYVEKLKETDVDNAGEFIYTASLLIHIKSRMLLPREPATEAGDEPDDPRRELVERLLEHERFKNAAQMLLQKQQIEAAVWTRPQLRSFLNETDVEGEIAADVPDLVRAFRDILDRLRNRPVLDVAEDAATVGQMIDYVRRRLLLEDRPVSLSKLLSQTRSERGLIALFLALLEMVRLQAILLRQDGNFSEVYVKKQEGFETLMEERIRQMQDDWH